MTSSQWQILVAGDRRGRLTRTRRDQIIDSGVLALACASSIDEYVMADVVVRAGDRCVEPMLEHALDPSNARANHVAAAMGLFPAATAVRAIERTVGSGDPLVVMRSLDACLRMARNGLHLLYGLCEVPSERSRPGSLTDWRGRVRRRFAWDWRMRPAFIAGHRHCVRRRPTRTLR